MCDPSTYVYSQLGMTLQSNMVLARSFNSLQAFCLSHPIPSQLEPSMGIVPDHVTNSHPTNTVVKTPS